MPAARTLPSGWRPESFLNQAREPLIALSAERRILQVNRAWEELTGHTEAEVVGLECRPHGPGRAGDLAGLAGSFYPPPEAMAGQPSGGRTMIVRKGGERVERRVEFWPFHGPDGALVGLLGSIRPLGSASPNGDAASQSLRFALLELRARMFARRGHDALIGRGPEHERALEGVDLAIASTTPVLIRGEAGTGKRFVARLIHQRGSRRQMPLLGYDVRAIPAEILGRELFGDPSPADPADPGGGGFLAPAGTTLVLGDVVALPRDLQARLAAALSRTPRAVRLIATTEADLDEALADDRLRPDLYHALNVLTIRLRPLRDRLDELPLIAQALLERANLRGDATRAGFSPAAIDALIGHDWPGNLRELARVVDAAHRGAAGEVIEPDDLPATIRGERGGAYLPAPALAPASPAAGPLKDRLLAYERGLIEEALAQARRNKAGAARRLGVNRPFLYRRMKELGIVDGDASPGHLPDEGQAGAPPGPGAGHS